MEHVLENKQISLQKTYKVPKTNAGKIKIKCMSKSNNILNVTFIILAVLSVYTFTTFNLETINFSEALKMTAENVKTIFLTPQLHNVSVTGILYQLLITFCLGVMATIFGAVIAFFGALASAKNLSSGRRSNFVKACVAFVRAVPTVVWVLIFAVSAGLGSVAAVIGLTFHSAGYLIKAYAETFEEIDNGVIEALKASGASFWQIVFQAIIPSSITSLTAWTFMRFEINVAAAIAVGAAAGAGGIGYDMFMASHFYFDLQEMGFITLTVLLAIILLEMVATRLKAKVS